MKRMYAVIVMAALAGLLALFAGCSSSSSSSAAASGSAGSASASASTSAGAGASSAAIDPSNLHDGEYKVAVTLVGGSGKASVESPAKLIVAAGDMTAVIVWSSSNYDLMVVDGEEYLPVPRAGNSTFEIPVSTLDTDQAVKARTTVENESRTEDYTLHFDSSTLQAS